MDEHDSNDDDDYNYSATAGQRVSYDFESLGLTGTVKGVQHVATMRKDDDKVRLVKMFSRIGGTDYDGPQISVNDTYVAQRHQSRVQNPLPGWVGHDDPFAMAAHYRPAPSIRRLLTGTPSVLSLSALDAALDAYDGVSMAELRAVSISLTTLLMDLVD